MASESGEATNAMEKMEIDEKVVSGTTIDEKPDAGGDTPVLHEKDAAASETPEGDDDDDDDDSSSTTFTDDDDDSAVSPDKADELLIKATSLKELGNTHFKSGELDQAARSYRRGCNSLKNLNKGNLGDEQVKSLLTALQTNLSMVLCKQKRYRASADMATKVIDRDERHVKALYRRAVAMRQMGELEKARADLRTALQADPSNAACKKELAAVKKEIEKVKDTQKKALAKAFSKDSSLLYNDKEAAEKRRLEEERKKKKAEQELYKKRKQEWEDECVHRMANDEEAISFEDWEKEQKEKEEAKQKEERQKREEEERKRKAEAKKRREAARKKEAERDDDSSDEELTEQELAMMRGYKKTKDGRTTSYFTREMSEEERRNYDVAPKRLGEVSNTAPTRLGDAVEDAKKNSPSAWNQAGTWEEKDTTSWCTSQLRKRLDSVSVTDSASLLDADIVSVKDLSGHASVAMAAGKKRYIFEYESRLEYEIKSDDDKIVCTGNVRLPDVCSTHHDEVEVAFDSWSKRPSKDMEAKAMATRDKLAAELRCAVQDWVQDFNGHY